MWLEWFFRCSISTHRLRRMAISTCRLCEWPFRIVYDECRRRRYILSFTPLLFSNKQNINLPLLNNYNWQNNDHEKEKYDHRQHRWQSTLFASSIIGALTSATIFSWDHDGISDEELLDAGADQYMLNMSNGQIDQLLVAHGWEKILRKDHLMLFRKYDHDLEVYSYKIFGTFNDISALLFLQVQLDLDYRMMWDDHAVSLSIIDSDDKTQSDVVHWIQKFPFPFNNRDYVYVRRYCLDTSSPTASKIIIKCHSINHPYAPDYNKCVRVNKYESSMIIQAKTHLDETGMKFLLTYHEDAKASIPTSTYSYLAQTGIPGFVEKLHIAAKKLPKSGELMTVDSLPKCFPNDNNGSD